MSFWGKVGGDALGLLIGNLSGTYGTGDTLNEKRRKDAESDALALERHGIVNRVEGYKAAGLHPVLAAGGTPTSSVPISMIGTEMPARGYSDDPKPDPNIERYNAARARLAEAEATKAERDLAASRTAVATQPGQPRGVITSDANAGLGSSVTIKPDEVVAGRGGHTAGTHQGMTRFEFPGIPGGLSLPSAASSNALEDLEALKYASIFAANWDRLINAARELNEKAGKKQQWYLDQEAAKKEVENLSRRFPPKGNWRGGRRAGGYVER